MVLARKKALFLGVLHPKTLQTVLNALPIECPNNYAGLVRKMVSNSSVHIRIKKHNALVVSVNGFKSTLRTDHIPKNFSLKFSSNSPFLRNTSLLNDLPKLFNIETQVRGFRVEKNNYKFGKELLPGKYNHQDKIQLTAMINDPSKTHEEKESIKVAFAEGYLNGSTNAAPKKTIGVLKILQHLLSISVLWILIFMIGTNSFFKIGTQMAINPETINVTFDDVKGVNDAKLELEEVVEFLKNPDKFLRMGGKLPKGVLLVGNPGTGKTLLARALAGEAGVPFFHTCGSEFDEMLVGQGARRVRDLFKVAKEHAPCVIFIDEIDAVGCKRTNSLLHPHANQTVNQLLAEMDGFNANEGVIVLGATNRREDLDPALLRPGRFDLEVVVSAPDYQGRREIVSHYLHRVRMCNDVDLDLLARGTVGFTGADIENMVNQAAIRAAADGIDCIPMLYFEAARDKAIMGSENRSRILDQQAKEITAYHEAGHALVAYFTKHSQPLHKVTIVARGSSLGHTAYMPEKDKYHITKAELLAQIDTMMGGRAAEDIIFGGDKVTSGAASDIKSATDLATRMVRDWGMSEKAGLRSYAKLNEQNNLGESTRDIIDKEINVILQDSYDRAKKLLITYAREHKLLAERLLQEETLDVEQIKRLLDTQE